MNFVKLKYNGRYYIYQDSNDIPMTILGRFLISDVCYDDSFFREGVLDPTWRGGSGNITMLEIENGFVYLSDLYSEEEVPTELQMTIKQFIQLLDDWQTKVCKARPYLVTIKHKNDQFIIETEN